MERAKFDDTFSRLDKGSKRMKDHPTLGLQLYSIHDNLETGFVDDERLRALKLWRAGFPLTNPVFQYMPDGKLKTPPAETLIAF